MGKANASGHSLTNKDASIILGMVDRGDREHDIAVWFGVNQARIAEVNPVARQPRVSCIGNGTSAKRSARHQG